MVSPTAMKSMVLSVDVGNATNKSEIGSHLLHTAAILIKVDPNQPKALIKLPISIRRDSLQYHTSALIDLATTLNFVSQNFLTRNDLLGTCTRCPKIVVRIANKQKISTSKTFSPTNVSMGQKLFTGLNFTVLPHLKCIDFIFGLPTMIELNMSIQPSNDLMLIGDTPFQCESQPRRVCCLLVDSAKMKKN